MKVLENAKEAILHGVAGEQEFDLVTKGAVVTSNGEVVPEVNGPPMTKVNGDVNGHARRKREREDSGTPPVRDRHDIRYVHKRLSVKLANKFQSLHNVATEPQRGYE
jgi:amidophosphoribosyltransferase